ncbi:MAG: aminopeptidase P family protein [Desulfobulbaceae bacterium]|nr:aminopeptidase P family protein [Desulfobulbaceae bacterium]
MNNLDRLKSLLRRQHLDALLVTQPDNRRYLSGYKAGDMSISESSGVLLVPRRGSPLLLTDFRYQLQAEREAVGWEVRLYQRGLFPLLQRILGELGIKSLGFESHYFLHQAATKLQKLATESNIELVPVTDLVERLRICKSPAELAKIRAAVRLNEEVFQEVYQQLKPGLSERQVALRIETLMRGKGAERPSFETIVASGPNGALPHAVPGERLLREGEPIVIDMGLVLDGYCSDMTRTVVLGEMDDLTRQRFRLVRQAQLAGMAAVRAGVSGRQVDRAARQVLVAAGYGAAFGHSLGHGVGLAVHEPPSLSARYHRKLQAGMVVTVEPGIYLPEWGGIRLENMVEVTASGCKIMNADTTCLDV